LPLLLLLFLLLVAPLSFISPLSVLRTTKAEGSVKKFCPAHQEGTTAAVAAATTTAAVAEL
jgi:hypothetical protein